MSLLDFTLGNYGVSAVIAAALAWVKHEATLHKIFLDSVEARLKAVETAATTDAKETLGRIEAAVNALKGK